MGVPDIYARNANRLYFFQVKINMLFGLLKDKPLLDEDTVSWLFETYAWALNNFGSDVFLNETVMVLPNNEFFPGDADNPHDMASLIFEQVKKYAGLGHWPCKLLDQSVCNTETTPKVMIEGAIRGSKGIVPESVADENKLLITYHPDHVKNPQALIASYAHTLSHYMGTMAEIPSPGGEEFWPQTTEVLAVFMGFGLIFSNSAYTFNHNKCGSCAGNIPNRSGYLSQYEMTYAFAIFCVLKNISNKDVLPNMKKSLRSFFKKSIIDIKNRRQDLALLTAIDAPLEIQ
jgi:hypothetical protein